jgi:hypothetical protein
VTDDILRERSPNQPVQPTASRTRALGFEREQERSRRRHGSALGGFIYIV